MPRKCEGRGGFKLSASALNAREDYEWITKGGGYQDNGCGPRRRPQTAERFRHYLPNTVIAPAADISREQVCVFLGRRLDCAQCHNYENWTQNQFWGLAALFDRVFILSNTLTDSVIFDHPCGEDLGSADVRGSGGPALSKPHVLGRTRQHGSLQRSGVADAADSRGP
ncbi:MAG: hypothetical protein DMG57_38630 [Acidobacteria bacterium]|nr:MAG: hypothetical protein DMG57_38630 [Acidobacteriota bacterium]